jgi:hypothetical protein
MIFTAGTDWRLAMLHAPRTLENAVDFVLTGKFVLTIISTSLNQSEHSLYPESLFVLADADANLFGIME